LERNGIWEPAIECIANAGDVPMTRRNDWTLSFHDQIAHRMWPEILGGSHLLDVAQIGQQAIESGGTAGTIAGVLILQQLAEQQLGMVDYWCYYEVALSIYPTEIIYDEPGRMMFGQLINRVEKRQAFPGKRELLAACRETCTSRNPIAHTLVNRDIFYNTEQTAVRMTELSRIVRERTRVAEAHFREKFDFLADRTGIPSRRTCG
jgi:hypothetical protein